MTCISEWSLNVCLQAMLYFRSCGTSRPVTQWTRGSNVIVTGGFHLAVSTFNTPFNGFSGRELRVGVLKVSYNIADMDRKCRERFPCHRLQRNPLVSHKPWCMSGSLTRYGMENVTEIPGACTTRNFTYLASGPYSVSHQIHIRFWLWFICCAYPCWD